MAWNGGVLKHFLRHLVPEPLKEKVRVRFELNNVVATFHRPHPQKEAKPYQVRDARRFLQQAGITP